ncbi:MAG: septum formation protein Maf [Bacteroidetes bacterium]|nr:MAG: septum formation protein Maf [Bacteroidota bacterium]
MKFFEKLKSLDLVLASQSPRRKALLEEVGFPFRIWVIPSDESFPQDLPTNDIALYLCRQKAKPFKGLMDQNTIVITADTIVVKGNRILNKADNPAEARSMLSILSGTTHQVITGVCLTSQNHRFSFTETTTVKFTKLEPEEINHYIKTCQPFDKAGAYGIQEWIGAVAVESIQGSYHNVVGLPVATLYRELKSFVENHF